MASSYEPKSVMGKVFMVGGMIIAPAVALAKGGVNALQGRDFYDGTMEAMEATVGLAAEFGDEHGGKIVRRVLTGLLIGIGMDVGHDFFDHDA